jgi:hypothetical protein
MNEQIHPALRGAAFRRIISGLTVVLIFIQSPALASADETLPSWNDDKAKTDIVAFVNKVTTKDGDGYVAPEDRIAVFDNDGTLWSEQPFYTQLIFAMDRVKILAPAHPEWNSQEPFESAIKRDIPGVLRSGEKGLVNMMEATHSGMTTQEFDKIVGDWFATARHPKTGKPYYEMTFQPMIELLSYLRANGFKTYIVSGGGVEFMRPMTGKMYGIPPEQVIGSTAVTTYALRADVPVLMRQPEINFINDGAGKPVGINQVIGRRPIFAAGNSDGDYEMLRWVSAGSGPHFAMIVHHTDEVREYAYDRRSIVGKLDKALDEAVLRNWLLVDMKSDWKKIYPFD